MYVERIPNRNSPPAILLRESYRDGDKFKKRTLANLSDWPAAKIEALRRVLHDEAVAPTDQQALTLLAARARGGSAGHIAQARARPSPVAGRAATAPRGEPVHRHDRGAAHRSGLQAGNGAWSR